jgi:exonuclease SbcC
MLFRFFKPKWRHKDPVKRCKAVAELAPDDHVLLSLARSDESPAVRAAAISKISDIAFIHQILEQEQHSTVLEKANSRLRELLCGKAESTPPLHTRLLYIEKAHNKMLIKYIALHGTEIELRQQAVAILTDLGLLFEIALNDRAPEIRISAVERIDDVETLERIVKEAKKGDKRVTQLARQRLGDLRKHIEQTQFVASLCDDLETLCESGSYAIRQRTLAKAERERLKIWEAIDKEIRERFSKAFSRLRDICDQYRKTKTSKQQACQILEKLEHELHHEDELSDELEHRMQTALAQANEHWNVPGELEAADDQILSQRYRRFGESIIAHQSRLHENAEKAQRIRSFFFRLEQAIEAGQYSSKKSIEKLRTEWESLPKPTAVSLTQKLNSRFKQLIEQIEQQRAKAAEAAIELEKSLIDMIARLNQSVENGQLNDAISLRDQIRHQLDKGVGLANTKRGKFESSLKAMAPRIRELQGWRTWSTSDVRERLCEQAQALLATEQSPHERAEAVKELRETWKKLDKQGGFPANEAIWERFNATCNQAYEPCLKAFEEEARQREQNLSRKKAVCEKLERLNGETDWENVDWKALIKKYNTLRQDWRQTGPVSKVQQSTMAKSFQNSVQKIESNLEKQRQAGLHKRKRLIEQVQAMSEECDLTTAVEQTKRAQAEWNTVIVRASHKTEQKLWQEFRTACDKIFERRDTESKARLEVLAQNAEKKAEYCNELESLIEDLQEHNLQNSLHHVERIKYYWKKVGESPKEDRITLENRFNQASSKFDLAVQQIYRLQVEQTWKALQERARLCTALEALLEHLPANAEEIDSIKATWHSLPELKKAEVSDLEARFERNLFALLGDEAIRDEAINRLQAAAEDKRLQCLEMELLAGIDSPPEYGEERMRLKVTRLSARFEGGLTEMESKPPYEIALEAQRHWVRSGMLPAEEMQALEYRFTAAAETLLTANSTPGVIR